MTVVHVVFSIFPMSTVVKDIIKDSLRYFATLSEASVVTISFLNANGKENGVGAAVLRVDPSDPLIGCPVVDPTLTTAACPLTVCLFLHNNI